MRFTVFNRPQNYLHAHITIRTICNQPMKTSVTTLSGLSNQTEGCVFTQQVFETSEGEVREPIKFIAKVCRRTTTIWVGEIGCIFCGWLTEAINDQWSSSDNSRHLSSRSKGVCLVRDWNVKPDRKLSILSHSAVSEDWWYRVIESWAEFRTNCRRLTLPSHIPYSSELH